MPVFRVVNDATAIQSAVSMPSIRCLVDAELARGCCAGGTAIVSLRRDGCVVYLVMCVCFEMIRRTCLLTSDLEGRVIDGPRGVQ